VGNFRRFRVFTDSQVALLPRDWPCQSPIGVGNGFRRPRPPNRACGSPAHGSPVGGFLIGIGSLTHRCNRVNNQMCREKALAICLLNAVSGAANMRSVHTEASIHVQSRPWISAPCLTLTGTPGATVCSRCGSHASTFLPPFPRRGFAFRPSRGSRRFGTMETLTSYAAHLQRRSPRILSPYLPIVPSPTTWAA
jgi:hypothetical protein